MHKLLMMSCVLLAVVLAGCGGGSSSNETQAFDVALTVPAGAAPVGVTPQVTERTVTQVPLQPAGPVFIAGAECLPPGTNFSQPVTLTFTLTIPLATGESVGLFQYATASGWTQVPGPQVAISGSRLTVTVSNVLAFPDEGYFALLILPNP